MGKNKFSADWLVKGILTKAGEGFDRLTGRNWKPSSSLATSELIEKVKQLLDIEVRDLGNSGKFAPHNITLKMQWDKFSTDSERSIEKLKNELHAAVIDHINDKRYYTYGPILLEIKPDYFTKGVKLIAGFERFDDDENEAAVNLAVPNLTPEVPVPVLAQTDESPKDIFVANYAVNGIQKEIRLAFSPGERKSVGRAAENDVSIDEISISNAHAALVFNSQRKLMVADTGSTNGTFINGRRISYGRAFSVASGDVLTFGSVNVAIEHFPAEEAEEAAEPPVNVETVNAGEEPVVSPTGKVAGSELREDRTVFDSEPLTAPEKIGDSIQENDETNPTRPGLILDFDDELR